MSYIDIVGDIDDYLADRVCNQIAQLQRTCEPVVLYIDTEGGFTSCLQKIVNSMIDSGHIFHAFVIGKAYSAGFDLCMFCEKIYALSTATFMFHLAILIDQNAQAFAISFGEPAFAPEEEFDTEVFRLVARRLNLSTDEVRQMARDEANWTATQALHAGIIDIIISD